MKTITRQQFQSAIEAGISASPCLTDAERESLREVGRTATWFDGYFTSNCPAKQAGLTSGNAEQRPAVAHFAWAFDSTLMCDTNLGVFDFESIEVVKG
jgi:hypothetical protein